MTIPTASARYTAFDGTSLLASGDAASVAIAMKRRLLSDASAPLLAFNDATAEQVEFDLRGTAEDIVARLQRFEDAARGAVESDTPGGPDADASPARRAPGRPRLGVVAREVTLLPRHWEWLGTQRGGASATLRRLVDEARKSNADADAARTAQDRTYRFMTTLAGNEPGFEEATRALYAGDRVGFDTRTAAWPADVRQYAQVLAEPTWPAAPDA